VPTVELVDLSALDTPKGTPKPLLAPVVITALRETFDRGGQAIVLYNRRGYATLVECGACGAGYECPSCGLAMTLHRAAWRLVCHYCGYTVAYSDECPVCHAHELAEEGKGTERIEEELAELFPDVAIARMDADTTAARGAHHHLLEGFRAGRTQLLVGTQIVAKGHDFPGVQTAVVVSADRGIRMPDFRASERTFSLLVQLAGRAGRGDVPGRVFVQTWKPDHYVLQHLGDPEGFLEAEARLRRQLRYPPQARLVLIRVEGVDRPATQRATADLARGLRTEARRFAGVDVLGPAPAALPRLVGRWRFQLILRGEQIGPFRAYLQAIRDSLSNAARQGVRVAWDVDPRHLM
jgi:primosomal protein N' (replication factor Y)